MTAAQKRERRRVWSRYSAINVAGMLGGTDALEMSWALDGAAHRVVICSHLNPLTIDLVILCRTECTIAIDLSDYLDHPLPN